MRAVFDTNILIDYLNGINEATTEMERFDGWLVSRITWIEVMVGARSSVETKALTAFFEYFQILELSALIAAKAVEIRRDRRIRLPDAMIWATADEAGSILVTRNVRDFPAENPMIRVPYQV